MPLIAGNLQTLVKIMGCSRYNTCIHLKVTGEDWLSGAYCPGTIQDVGLPSYTKEGGVPKKMVSDNLVKKHKHFLFFVNFIVFPFSGDCQVLLVEGMTPFTYNPGSLAASSGSRRHVLMAPSGYCDGPSR